MIKLLAISGSLHAKPYNSAPLRAATHLASAGVSVEIAPIQDIALYFRDFPVAFIGASPGGFSTVLAQAAWLPVLRALGMRAWFGDRLLVSRAGHVFGTQMTPTDDAVREQLREFIARFAEFAASAPRRFVH
ncbi:hypothetical protein DIE15_12075 [Burkholderia sp. Bp9031]|uniref:NADPH-dependent FMN reductase n=1 Tax=Burkholderia sp. Bp9031 TaxID=2184566 RepID=UPI000F5E145C|nr:hypothetical protein [Burkholderia sp. Bp9031]RQZ17206.1 hypothetical protein DIE15_12075 [Burkholderia sp. Bp9031]